MWFFVNKNAVNNPLVLDPLLKLKVPIPKICRKTQGFPFNFYSSIETSTVTRFLKWPVWAGNDNLKEWVTRPTTSKSEVSDNSAKLEFSDKSAKSVKSESFWSTDGKRFPTLNCHRCLPSNPEHDLPKAKVSNRHFFGRKKTSYKIGLKL